MPVCLHRRRKDSDMQNYNNTFKKESQLKAAKRKNQPYVHDIVLGSQTERKFIGTVDLAGEGTFTSKRAENKHLFKKLNAIGLNHRLLTTDKISFKWIVINYQTSEGRLEKLVTSRNFWKKYGQTFQFSNKGYELQSFLSLNQFGIEKARQYEKELNSQTEMFKRKAV